MKLRLILPQLLLVGFCFAFVFAVKLEAPTVVRSAMSLMFLLFCPGLAYVPLLKIQDQLINFVLVLALSMALGVLVTESIVLIHDWSSDRALFFLIALTLFGVVLQIFMSLRKA